MVLVGALENFHTELIFRIEDLRVKRDTIRTLLQVEEEEKIAIQRGLIMLNQRLVQIDDSLSRKYDYTIECDKRIHEIIEAATDSKSPQTFSSPRLSFDMFQGSEVGLRSGNLCLEEDP
ncbi:hypothetical protein CY35_18G082700 [Sphagnum magellanicum]|nr:hypothetical protein CY35_18G082700 [Sphagnum magellanicum]